MRIQSAENDQVAHTAKLHKLKKIISAVRKQPV